MGSGDDSDDEPMFTEMLEDISDGSQYHPNVNRREARYKYVIVLSKDNRNGKQRLKLIETWGKGSHKVFKTVVKEISQDFPPLGESGS